MDSHQVIRDRVIGRVAMLLQGSGGPLAAAGVHYALSPDGGIQLSWTGGPTALVLAIALSGLPDAAVSARDCDAPGAPDRAILTLSGIRVLLIAQDADVEDPDVEAGVRQSMARGDS